MKRLNPETNKPFKRGDIRADGYRFWVYTKRLKQNGYFTEQWYSAEAFKQQKQLSVVSAVSSNKKHPDRLKKCIAKWSLLNRDKRNKTLAKRRAARLERTPPWMTQDHFDEIEDFYTIAKMFQMYTGQEYHVDHIVPLQGKNVSGLHTPWNLQVIPAKENLSKGNKHVVF